VILSNGDNGRRMYGALLRDLGAPEPFTEAVAALMK
jgi:hypothetical protein